MILFSIFTTFKINLPSFGFSNEQIQNIFKPFIEKYKNSNVWNNLAQLDINNQSNLEVIRNEYQTEENRIKKEEEKIPGKKEEKKDEKLEEKNEENRHKSKINRITSIIMCT